MPDRFLISLDGAFGDSFSWRLKDGELRYRGEGLYAGFLSGRIPVREDDLKRFRAACDLLEVRRWRDNYDAFECGWSVMDGYRWSFRAEFDGAAAVRSGGCNAYPSYADPGEPSLTRDRFGLLGRAFLESFNIAGVYHTRRAEPMPQSVWPIP